MKNLSCFLGGCVVYDLESEEKYQAIHELITRAPIFKKVQALDRFERAVIRREKVQSTGLGHGIALTHGKTDAVSSFFIALGISRKGIDFNSYDHLPVHFLFVVANPPDYQDEYLPAISSLTGILRDEDFRRKLLSMSSSSMIERALHEAFSDAMFKYYHVGQAVNS